MVVELTWTTLVAASAPVAVLASAALAIRDTVRDVAAMKGDHDDLVRCNVAVTMLQEVTGRHETEINALQAKR